MPVEAKMQRILWWLVLTMRTLEGASQRHLMEACHHFEQMNGQTKILHEAKPLFMLYGVIDRIHADASSSGKDHCLIDSV